MTNANRALTIELSSGNIQIEAKFAEPYKITFEEKATEENNYKVGNKAVLRLNSKEAADLVRALEYINDIHGY